ncbi:hypothetical protein BASA81_008414 [Batrachochytrium salamandrivorans]|nr:hypothetical protein BASA81_008414 [Batrachochytrium salamandrivorans]
MLANQLVLNGAKTTHSVPAAAAIATTTTTTTQAAKVMEEEEEEEDANYKRRTYYKLGEFQTPTTSLNHAEFSQVQLTQFLSDAKRKKEEKDAKKAAVAVENGPEQRRKLLRGDATLEYTLVLDSEAINGTKQLVEEEEEDEEDVVVVVKRPKTDRSSGDRPRTAQ